MSYPRPKLAPLARVVLALVTASIARSADVATELSLTGIQAMIEQGSHEHAIRAVDRLIAAYPKDPRLPAYRAQIVALQARETGRPSTPPGVPSKPPPEPRRRAEPGHNFTTETAELVMNWIPPGTFTMSNPHGSDDDTVVTLSQGFWLARTELTQEQWGVLMDHLPLPSLFRGSDRPVERVAWVNAVEFCHKLTELERAGGRLPAGYEYTLPTEAQWEYACRAGTTGSRLENLDAIAWHLANSGEQTHPVAQKLPNAWGLYDMMGNVTEWCYDGYQGYPGGHATDLRGDFTGPSAATFRISRGGAWASPAGTLRPGYRFWHNLQTRTAGVGFRVALAPLRPATPVEKRAENPAR